MGFEALTKLEDLGTIFPLPSSSCVATLQIGSYGDLELDMVK